LRPFAYLTFMTFLLALALLFALQQPIDATALTFTLEKDSFTVRVGRWKLKTKEVLEMNRFVDLHIKEIDPNKIVIYGDGHAEYKTFQPVIEVLKKHDWIRFRLEDTGPKRQLAKPKVQTRQT